MHIIVRLCVICICVTAAMASKMKPMRIRVDLVVESWKELIDGKDVLPAEPSTTPSAATDDVVKKEVDSTCFPLCISLNRTELDFLQKFCQKSWDELNNCYERCQVGLSVKEKNCGQIVKEKVCGPDDNSQIPTPWRFKWRKSVLRPDVVWLNADCHPSKDQSDQTRN